MKSILSFLLCLFMLIPQLSPFSTVWYSALSNDNTSQNQEVTDTPAQDSVATEATTEETGATKITLDNTLDLEGYCTVGVPSDYFEVIPELSTATQKVLKYKDQKTRLTISYVLGLTSDLDIPGYMCKQVAQVDTTTNSKHEDTYGSNTWWTVPADKAIEEKNETVYYSLGSNNTTACWMKLSAVPETDADELNSVMEKILAGYSKYYIGESVFKTPTTGYYAEHNTDGGVTAEGTGNYVAENEDNTVHKTGKTGFTDANISTEWTDMEIMIDGTKFKIPASLGEFLNAGFFINEMDVNGDTTLSANGIWDLSIMNSKGTSAQVKVINDLGTGDSKLKDCHVAVITLDSTKFVSPSEATRLQNGGDAGEGAGGGTGSVHQVIITKGIDFDIYVEDLLDAYGDNYYYTALENAQNQYTWKWKNNSMTIVTGAVRAITSVTLSTVEEE